MIFTQLMGGLGNQMFQYAAGRALSLRLGLPLQIDLSWFHSSHTCTPREYALGVFPIAASFARDEEVAELRKQENSRLNRRLRKIFGNRGWWRRCFVREPHFHYWPGFENLKGPAMLEGYWQSENYFAASAGTIREDFAFPPLPAGAAAALAEEMRDTPNSVSVHIRRGDYATSPDVAAVHGLCSPAYYRRALEIISDGRSIRLFLFSDEPDWVRTHFNTCGHEAVIVDLGGEAVHDMHLMSLCRGHVLANSSFSWWGAWLGRDDDIVCAPRRWFLNPSQNAKDLTPKRWQLVDDRVSPVDA